MLYNFSSNFALEIHFQFIRRFGFQKSIKKKLLDTQKLGKENLLQSHTKCGNIQYVFYFENRKHTQYIKFIYIKRRT